MVQISNIMQSPEVTIFGFGGFISALALLVIVYTVTDVRYRFRVAITPIPLFYITYLSIAIIGFGTLITDLYFAKHWPLIAFLDNQLIWQTIFGGWFLLLILAWIYYAFINPPIFCKRNYKKFAQQLYRVILKGSDTELSVIADELLWSAKSIVSFSKTIQEYNTQKNITHMVENYAYDIILLIANRKFCRHIMVSSPLTAILFFEAMSASRKYEIPIGQFAKNISTEALLYKDSILYHEDEGYRSGLLGYHKPFSRTIYGDYQLVETLAMKHSSPFEMHYEMVSSWDATQLKTYCRVLMITLESYINHIKKNGYEHSYVLCQAIEKIKNSSCGNVYKLNNTSADFYSLEISEKLRVAVNFIDDAITLFNKLLEFPITKLRIRKRSMWDLYDHIAKLMFDIVFAAASVKSPADTCWSIQYVTVWDSFFSFPEKGKAGVIIRHKLRRLLYDEVCRLKQFPNYKSSAILGFCLNVMGLTVQNKRSHDKNFYPLHKAIIAWVKKNYLHLRKANLDVAQSCLVASISFDESKICLVKTYAKGLSIEAPREYLYLSEK